ncbi:hypothetical protein TNCV_2696951 [Trichonephila clavipes]|nr:hypothetical protein TNCV_2696951 [Trichonephila clavipes]
MSRSKSNTINNHSTYLVEMWPSAEPVCAKVHEIVSRARLFVSNSCLYEYLTHTMYAIYPGWALSRSRSTGGPPKHYGVTAFTQLNSVVQQPLRAKVYCVNLSFRNLEVHEQMLRSGGQPNMKPPVFSSQANLALIYRPTERIKD